MREEEKYIKSFDGELIYAKEYLVDNPKATIIVTTDIKEHALLYNSFAKTMTELNYNVFTYDLRAHKNSAKEPFGTYSKNFFNDCVRDLLYLNKYLTKKYLVPAVNIGLGTGSVIICRMLQFNNEASLNVLIGIPFEKLNISNYFYRVLTRLTMVFLNKHSEAKNINKLINYSYTRKFQDTAYLSTNKEYIDIINNDKFCNFNLSANILNSIYRGYIETFSSKHLNKIDRNHKFMLCSGEFDVITKFCKSTHQISNKFAKLNIKHEKIIFKDLRHNLINESNTAFIEYLEKFIKENLENDKGRD